MIDGKLLAQDRESALRITPVSRETAERLDRFVAHFLKWQQAVQLVAPSTLNTVWTRHIADSLQLLPDIEDAKEIVDVGSGGGFPGLVLAIASPDKKFHLVESDTRKASFLREAARIADAPATVYAERVESVAKRIGTGIQTVTARAFAPLPKLLELTEDFLRAGAKGVFLKSQDIDDELTTAAKSWNVNYQLRNSLTDPRGRILLIDKALRR
ncbi:MAG: 16S rRNA (guanine(527)-N(7))-methyltransferase RsmG [Xanthobacteraceae bacterium]|nr:16S rRNA (guanine(527)-N(7))-methyltransferase RsmG [Xanthobacteraceae bacterium]MCW5677672.1 16S rRNA (guanine(527)-N(7))-methyltransferase RsmG [Xanthobacteraceae bacterium]